MLYKLFIYFGLLFLIIISKSSNAEQISFQTEQKKESTDFQYQWNTAKKETQTLSFSLPNSLLEIENTYSITPPMQPLLQAQADAVNTWARMQKDVVIIAKVGANNSVTIDISGQSEAIVNQKYREAEQIRDSAKKQSLQKTGYQEVNGKILPDFVTLIQEYSQKLSPLAKGLKQPEDSLNDYSKRVLAFVQNIPYDETVENVYRRPISILSANRGDCDSKAVLFLALIKAVYPEIPVAIVGVPLHTFVLIGSSELDSEMKVEIGGQAWVPMESVGPSLSLFGELRDESMQHFRSGDFRLFIAP